MPGVLDSNLDTGVCREVGKMAFFTGLLDFDPEDMPEFEEIANKFFNNPSLSPRDSGDSEGELPDESTVDLLKFLDSDEPGTGLSKSLLCDSECNQCNGKNPRTKGKVSGNDPFMSSVNLNKSIDSSNNSASLSFLSQIISPLDDHHHPAPQQQDTFNAWSHTSNTNEYHIFNKTSLSTLFQEEEAEESFPETPSISEQTMTDDSDVDIETVTDVPRTADLCPSSGSSSSPSPVSSPCTSPPPCAESLQKGSLMSILSRSTSSSLPSSSNKASLLRFNSCGVSSSASLAENLMSGRSHSISGQKRKLKKERTLAMKTSSASSTQASLSPASYQASASHILVNSNSVNFHDYALNPGACTMPSTETAGPTVMAKRMYRKRQYPSLDITDKEKQHHHNQLERNRRQKLADLFTDLRDEVPKIKNQSKASKVVILNDATDYIRDMQRLEHHQNNEKESLMQRQLILKEQLRRLQQGSYSLLL